MVQYFLIIFASSSLEMLIYGQIGLIIVFLARVIFHYIFWGQRSRHYEMHKKLYKVFTFLIFDRLCENNIFLLYTRFKIFKNKFKNLSLRFLFILQSK